MFGMVIGYLPFHFEQVPPKVVPKLKYFILTTYKFGNFAGIGQFLAQEVLIFKGISV